jgi:two-component system sensor histidine kinase BarA
MDLPVFDWNQALQLAGQKPDLAKDILAMLMAELPQDTARINQAYKDQNYPEMLRLVHKLHGALCYSGMPRLKTVIAKLETTLKTNIMGDLPAQIDLLNTEVGLLLEYHSCQPYELQ